MPTNILRSRSSRIGGKAAGLAEVAGAGAERHARLTAGRVVLRLRLAPTATADRIWAALPLFSTAETWGDCLHFEVPVKSGRERGARLNGLDGEVYFWSEDDRVLLAWGPTAISREGERRLPRPCNVWAHLLDDAAALEAVTPGERVALERA